MNKRLLCAYVILLGLLFSMAFRVYYLSISDSFAQAAQSQQTYTLDVVQERAGIYDTNLQPLVNTQKKYLAAVLPSQLSTQALMEFVGEDQKADLLEAVQQQYPFVTELDSPDLYGTDIDVIIAHDRYGVNQLASHIIGHLDGDGNGATGIEKAFNDLLKERGGSVQVQYTVDALRQPIPGKPSRIVDTRHNQATGVVLTLDKELQQAAEDTMSTVKAGALVVMDCETGEILASVSRPNFDANNLAQYLDDETSPLVNRAFSEFAVGSTFKLMVAAAALENGVPMSQTYTCTGYRMVDGVQFNCNNLAGHGTLTMHEAIVQSCNAYFVGLMGDLGPNSVHRLADLVGFGKSTLLAQDYATGSGILPTEAQLAEGPEAANFSFGQGKLMATPVQVAQMISTIANGGYQVTPRLVKGTVADGELTLTDEDTPKIRILSEDTCSQLQDAMIDVVETQVAHRVKPEVGGAGGKTASAQTGVKDENGEEIVHGWFAGFYPAENPQYAIVALVENGQMGGSSAGPLFRDVANALAGRLENPD